MSIKFSLKCECSAKFEGWFPSNEDYEKQLAQGQLLCPLCDSTKVRKDIMSPNVRKKSTKTPRQRGRQTMVEMAKGQMVMGGKARTLLKKLEKHVTDNFENVGKNFAKEARKAIKGKRNDEFYGTATNKEADKLINEGIDLFHIPKIRDN
jgi:hypothetical protein